MAQQAQDTFVGSLPDGADHFVAKGAVFPDGHAVVKQWPGLFMPLDLGEQDAKPPAKSVPEAKPAAKEPAAKADVKPAAKPAAAAVRVPGRG